MRKSFIATLVGIICLTVGCTTNTSNTASTASSNTNTAADVVITLERTACRGFCPVYAVAVYDDGSVEYVGESNVETTGTQTSTITPSEVDQLVAAFEAADYMNLKDLYTERDITDVPSVVTSYTVDGTTKTVEHALGDDAPDALVAAEELVDELVNTDQWINGGTLDEADNMEEDTMKADDDTMMKDDGDTTMDEDDADDSTAESAQ